VDDTPPTPTCGRRESTSEVPDELIELKGALRRFTIWRATTDTWNS